MATHFSQRMFFRYRSRHSWWYRLDSGGQFGAKVQLKTFNSCCSVSQLSPHRSHRPSTLCKPAMPPMLVMLLSLTGRANYRARKKNCGNAQHVGLYTQRLAVAAP